MVPKTGLEPARREAHDPESCVSTNSTTWALDGDESGVSTRLLFVQPPTQVALTLVDEQIGPLRGAREL
jgi:hypothetical protein